MWKRGSMRGEVARWFVAAGQGGDARLDGGNEAALQGDVVAAAAVGEVGVFDDQVAHGSLECTKWGGRAGCQV